MRFLVCMRSRSASPPRPRDLRSFIIDLFDFSCSSKVLIWRMFAVHPSEPNMHFHSWLSRARPRQALESVEVLRRVSGSRYEKIWKVISGGRYKTGSRWSLELSRSTMAAMDAVRRERRISRAKSSRVSVGQRRRSTGGLHTCSLVLGQAQDPVRGRYARGTVVHVVRELRLAAHGGVDLALTPRVLGEALIELEWSAHLGVVVVVEERGLGGERARVGCYRLVCHCLKGDADGGVAVRGRRVPWASCHVCNAMAMGSGATSPGGGAVQGRWESGSGRAGAAMSW